MSDELRIYPIIHTKAYPTEGGIQVIIDITFTESLNGQQIAALVNALINGRIAIVDVGREHGGDE
jgi:hypothetical protein